MAYRIRCRAHDCNKFVQCVIPELGAIHSHYRASPEHDIKRYCSLTCSPEDGGVAKEARLLRGVESIIEALQWEVSDMMNENKVISTSLFGDENVSNRIIFAMRGPQAVTKAHKVHIDNLQSDQAVHLLLVSLSNNPSNGMARFHSMFEIRAAGVDSRTSAHTCRALKGSGLYLYSTAK
ncbi:hypothetical protein DDE83_008037 [Stemphylium lycopersici]|uniref:Uncharacterized protein n=1 Tax=Stemphylium lycopersici TaxID=183478 RepID=A0A364MUZ1_STELY|nr:hypothetical protein DDE83_008037 [Stemphylium lycopersici]